MTRTLKAWVAAFLATAAIVFVSVQWFDRPIALFFYSTGERHRIPIETADRIFSLPSIAAAVFVICGVCAITGRRLSRVEAIIAICTIGVLVTTVLKDQLKFVFGRTWPYLLRDDVYSFNFLRPGRLFESFPSGHAAVAAVVLTVLWILIPNKRILYAIAIVAIDVGLVVLNLHFLSDVVAGSFVGISVGIFTVALWRAIEPLMRGAAIVTARQNRD
jgi:membrane-associated phospholipid phosphatase